MAVVSVEFVIDAKLGSNHTTSVARCGVQELFLVTSSSVEEHVDGKVFLAI
jgi:hypothetical protein